MLIDGSWALLLLGGFAAFPLTWLLRRWWQLYPMPSITVLGTAFSWILDELLTDPEGFSRKWHSPRTPYTLGFAIMLLAAASLLLGARWHDNARQTTTLPRATARRR